MHGRAPLRAEADRAPTTLILLEIDAHSIQPVSSVNAGHMVISIRNIKLQRPQRSRRPAKLAEQLTHLRTHRPETTGRQHLIQFNETDLHSHPHGVGPHQTSLRGAAEILIPLHNDRLPLPTMRQNTRTIRKLRTQRTIRGPKNRSGRRQGTRPTSITSHKTTPSNARHAAKHERTGMPSLTASTPPMNKNTISIHSTTTLTQGDTPHRTRIIHAERIVHAKIKPPAAHRTHAPLPFHQLGTRQERVTVNTDHRVSIHSRLRHTHLPGGQTIRSHRTLHNHRRRENETRTSPQPFSTTLARLRAILLIRIHQTEHFPAHRAGTLPDSAERGAPPLPHLIMTPAQATRPNTLPAPIDPARHWNAG